MPEEGRDGDAETPRQEVPADPLAVVVDKPQAGVRIESLRNEGCYDDDRSVREYGSDAVALPVTAPPQETQVREVIRQRDPDYRTRDLTDLLAARGWSEAALATVPGSWAVIGSVILVTIPEGCPDEQAVGEALLELHGEAETVVADEGISGIERTPNTRVLVGERETETIHTEAGTRYALDPTTVMFSPGNQAERIRMGEVVTSNERVFDMFAGIGYFTLPMARAGAQVTATEINPTAFRYLLENTMLNEVSEQVEAYLEDCRVVADGLAVDRVIMGYYGAANDDSEASGDNSDTANRTNEAHEFLDAALTALEPGGVLHYHEATPETRLWEQPLTRLEDAVETTGRELEVLERRRVKSHSAGVAHVVVDARVQ